MSLSWHQPEATNQPCRAQQNLEQNHCANADKYGLLAATGSPRNGCHQAPAVLWILQSACAESA